MANTTTPKMINIPFHKRLNPTIAAINKQASIAINAQMKPITTIPTITNANNTIAKVIMSEISLDNEAMITVQNKIIC